MTPLRTIAPAEVNAERRPPLDVETFARVDAIIENVRAEGDVALRRYGEHYGEIRAGDPLVHDRSALFSARDALDASARTLLERTAERIATFASAQRRMFTSMEVCIGDAIAGHDVAPVEHAGCYAPGGSYPLPSSVLMTAVTARVAGVERVWVATPRASRLMLAAAAIAGAEAVVAVGGAHAIAALAYGTPSVPAVDVIAGPGNRWVTAAKQRVAGAVGIDMLAGPSELVVLADDSANPTLVAADLLAQAEHDAEALPVLLTTSASLIDAVNDALEQQLRTLATADVAKRSLANGFAVRCANQAEALATADLIAPEHLQIVTRDASDLARMAKHYGALFIGEQAAEVLADYGAGPNHVLPTGRSARFSGGLSVQCFLRIRTWLQRGDPHQAEDAAALARLEGLEGHARAADFRAILPSS